ncbi:MAG: 4a-hydroxytetrahydrobiopterin dehydratase [Halobacteriaceae archaeon]
MADLLSDAAIADRLPEQWSQDDDEIVRTVTFDAYLDGVGFAAGVAGLAEDAFHHPELTIGYKEVEIRLTSHEAGGVTEADIELAERIEGLV